MKTQYTIYLRPDPEKHGISEAEATAKAEAFTFASEADAKAFLKERKENGALKKMQFRVEVEVEHANKALQIIFQRFENFWINTPEARERFFDDTDVGCAHA